MIDKDSPAFPKICYIGGNQVSGSDGMTLRDYFAAKALQGTLATISDFGEDPTMVFKTLSIFSYKMADAMLEARE